MRDNLTKKYSNGEITVVWKPNLCIHSGICWRGLGTVFNPNERPWVKMEGGTSDEITAQVAKCPSGALSSFRNDAPESHSESGASTKVEVTVDGPLILSGDVTIQHSDGREEVRQRSTAFCRCGQSGKKPFCDGSHRSTGFKG